MKNASAPNEAALPAQPDTATRVISAAIPPNPLPAQVQTKLVGSVVGYVRQHPIKALAIASAAALAYALWKPRNVSA